MNSSQSELKPLVLDNSKLQVARSCMRKFHLRHIENLALPLKEGALSAGGAIHAAIAHYSEGATLEDSLTHALSKMDNVDWNDKEWRTPDKVVNLLKAFLPTIKREDIAEHKGAKVVEVSFAFPLEGISEQAREGLKKVGYSGEVLYAGKVDAIKRYNGLLHITDYKTTSRLQGDKRKGEAKYIPPWFFDQYRLHAATMGYLVGASLWLEEPVYGVCIEGLGWDAYGNQAFSSNTFTYSQDVLDEWLISTTQLVEQIALMIGAGSSDKMFNTDACFGYGRRCLFFDLCRSGRPTWENLKTMFVKDEWSPLSEDEVIE